MSPTYYITTPIYYVNDKPHIGHAYTSLACDVMARFKRLDGYDVMFVTGTDEHGQKVEKASLAADLDPQSFTNIVSQNFWDLACLMGFSQDDFIRTTETRHIAAAQSLWCLLRNNGHIYLDYYEGWYSINDETFYSEADVKNLAGQHIAPTGAIVERVKNPSYFFDLSRWQEKLLAFYEANPNFIAPESRRNEVIGFVKGGLRDLSISRTNFKWGIPVPDDEKHVMYVWLDALTNYITAVDFPKVTSKYTQYWPADLHIIGKDILRFHAVYWPAFLMGAGLEPPKRVFAHGWWTNDGKKISKSIGNVIDPIALIRTYGLDPVRYYLMRDVPFGSDGHFLEPSIIKRMTSDLSNDIGNLIQRVLSMVAKNFASTVPIPGKFTSEDIALLASANALLVVVRRHFDNQAFHKGLEEIFYVIKYANKYVDDHAPWALRKSDYERMATVLYTLVETIRYIAVLLQPIMPTSCAKMLDQLAVPVNARSFNQLATKCRLVPGTRLPKPESIFPRWVEPRGVLDID
ncbi:methionyl-tRNA synthetase [Candidatus Endolissoclinum faulkneri L2]|uniref:Methionine--tRNA ligase n=1 Tax=Candidatus Endolissoclinum faulkneri L2 TaxID=1193729 RepID=K7YSU6_9PROT|nr:methionine--tRNA ligase [Candidatus Endolissoclinum faulkneri]AFX99649.1 methionyl-tRNA synthetase [Candidatus Endolissoclinum faulkneri L2]